MKFYEQYGLIIYIKKEVLAVKELCNGVEIFF